MKRKCTYFFCCLRTWSSWYVRYGFTLCCDGSAGNGIISSGTFSSYINVSLSHEMHWISLFTKLNNVYIFIHFCFKRFLPVISVSWGTFKGCSCIWVKGSNSYGEYYKVIKYMAKHLKSKLIEAVDCSDMPEFWISSFGFEGFHSLHRQL